jgi:hypothetical protein
VRRGRGLGGEAGLAPACLNSSLPQLLLVEELNQRKSNRPAARVLTMYWAAAASSSRDPSGSGLGAAVPLPLLLTLPVPLTLPLLLSPAPLLYDVPSCCWLAAGGRARACRGRLADVSGALLPPRAGGVPPPPRRSNGAATAGSRTAAVHCMNAALAGVLPIAPLAADRCDRRSLGEPKVKAQVKRLPLAIETAPEAKGRSITTPDLESILVLSSAGQAGGSSSGGMGGQAQRQKQSRKPKSGAEVALTLN